MEKILGSIKKYWEKKTAQAKDYPVKTGGILADFWITIIGTLMAGGFGMSAYIVYYTKGDMLNFVFGLMISGAILCTVVYNFYYWTYRQMKAYEEKYGETGLGQEWLDKRNGKKEKDSSLSTLSQ